MLLTSSQHPARVSGVASLATRLADLPPLLLSCTVCPSALSRAAHKPHPQRWIDLSSFSG